MNIEMTFDQLLPFVVIWAFIMILFATLVICVPAGKVIQETQRGIEKTLAESDRKSGVKRE